MCLFEKISLFSTTSIKIKKKISSTWNQIKTYKPDFAFLNQKIKENGGETISGSIHIFFNTNENVI